MTVYFAHIGKTAGTSVRKAAYAAFGVDRCVCLYGPGMSGNTPGTDEAYFRPLEAGEGEEAAVAAIMGEITRKKARFFSSHHNSVFAERFAPENTMSFVREPVARTISHFNFFRARGLWEEPIEAFITHRRHRNVQQKTFRFLDFEATGVVGVTERFTESIELINDVFDFSLSPRRENRTTWRPWRKWFVTADRIDPAIRSEIEDMNALDMALYDRALVRFERQLAAIRRQR